MKMTAGASKKRRNSMGKKWVKRALFVAVGTMVFAVGFFLFFQVKIVWDFRAEQAAVEQISFADTRELLASLDSDFSRMVLDDPLFASDEWKAFIKATAAADEAELAEVRAAYSALMDEQLTVPHLRKEAQIVINGMELSLTAEERTSLYALILVAQVCESDEKGVESELLEVEFASMFELDGSKTLIQRLANVAKDLC